ncbi:MAG: hypothetical protein ACPG3U_09235 [Rhodothermales bacterium]
MAEKRTREELEARLKEKASSISERFDSLESNLPGKGLNVPAALKSKRNIKMGLAIGAGFLVGYAILNRSRSRPRGDYGESLDRMADRLGDAISDQLKRSDTPGEAVREALEQNPPIVQLISEKDGVLSGALKQLFRSGSSVLITELSQWLQHRLIEEKQDPDGA